MSLKRTRNQNQNSKEEFELEHLIYVTFILKELHQNGENSFQQLQDMYKTQNQVNL